MFPKNCFIKALDFFKISTPSSVFLSSNKSSQIGFYVLCFFSEYTNSFLHLPLYLSQVHLD